MTKAKTADEFKTIIVPAPNGKDVLEFRRRVTQPVSYEAYLPWEPMAGSGYYQIHKQKDWITNKNVWVYNRHRHAELGRFFGQTPDLELAMKHCAENFEKVARLHRWTEYMINNEPPMGAED